MKFDKEQIDFIETLLQDTLFEMTMQRNRYESLAEIEEYDYTCGYRMEYIRELIKYIRKNK